jgi:hypothetical protein
MIGNIPSPCSLVPIDKNKLMKPGKLTLKEFIDKEVMLPIVK